MWDREGDLYLQTLVFSIGLTTRQDNEQLSRLRDDVSAIVKGGSFDIALVLDATSGEVQVGPFEA